MKTTKSNFLYDQITMLKENISLKALAIEELNKKCENYESIIDEKDEQLIEIYTEYGEFIERNSCEELKKDLINISNILSNDVAFNKECDYINVMNVLKRAFELAPNAIQL